MTACIMHMMSTQTRGEHCRDRHGEATDASTCFSVSIPNGHLQLWRNLKEPKTHLYLRDRHSTREETEE